MEAGETQPEGLRGIQKLVSRLFGAEPGEYTAALWSFAYFFFVLGSYYMVRPIRETMAVESGPETIPLLFTGTFVAMLLATPVFGWVASRFPRRKFLPWVYGFFILNMLAFWAAFSSAVSQGESFAWLARVFFVWLSVFNLYVVSVFWSFMADLYTKAQGRRLFGMISAGGSIGALIGGLVTSALVLPIGFQNIFPISAAMLLAAVVCIRQLRQWVEQQQVDPSSTIASSRPLGGSALAGITHVFQSKYFMAIAGKSIIASLLGTALYMITANLVEGAFAGADKRTLFFSNINVATNTIALIAQLLIVKHAVARLGIGVTMSALPIISIVGFAALAIEPTLAVVAILTIVRRSLGFGFSKPTTDMLYSVVTPEEKYKVKNFIDTAIYRGGDVIGTWTLRPIIAALGIVGTSVIMVPFAALWAGIALWLGRDYRRRGEAANAGA
jgi:AAA family ATP:ADP antiporter